MNENTKPQNCFDQGALLDILIAHLHLKNDAQLARSLNVAAPAISKLRHHKLPVGAAMLLRMHEESGFTIKELRAMMGDHRTMFRPISLASLQFRTFRPKPEPQPKPLTSYLRKDLAH